MSSEAPPRTRQRRGSDAPTLHDVAARAGVAVMTASRVLAGRPNVRPEKVELVLRAAAEIGYRRNENARSLRPGQRTGLVGVIITNAANPYYAQMQLGIEEVFAAGGTRTLMGNTGEDVARERRLLQDFVGWHVDGLIVVSASADAEHLRRHSRDTPLVLAARSVEGLEVDTALIDDVGGTRHSVVDLIAKGHRRIGFLGLGMSVPTSARRLQGFREAHEAAGLNVDDDLVFTGSTELGAVQTAAAALISRAEPPTAVFCANNRNTIGLMHALPADRSAYPQLEVVAFDNFETADLMPLHLTIVDHDPHEMGRRAAEMLVQRLDGYAGPPRYLELATRQLG